MAERCRWAVIPAAGAGNRFGAEGAKQYTELLGKTLIEHTLEAVLAVDPGLHAVVAVAEDDEQWSQQSLVGHSRVERVDGGAERSDSVLAGLNALIERAAADDWVLVHDAARPCVDLQDIQGLLAAINEHPVGGLLAIPAVDTLKRSADGQLVEDTLDRQTVFQAQTPQIFRFGLLLEALRTVQQQRRAITDESSAVEQLGYKPKLHIGSRSNIKVTYAEDLLVAEAYLRRTTRRGSLQ